MHVSPSVTAALDRLRAPELDARAAFTPGAQPVLDENARAQTSYPTMDALSVCAPSQTCFVTRDAVGATHFTRDGRFSIHDGTLRAGDGNEVLGYDRNGRLASIRVDPVDWALERASDARIDENGNLLYDRRLVDPRAGNIERRPVVAGRLALARFPAGTRLAADGTGVVPSAGAIPQYGVAGSAGFGQLLTMRRESSGIDLDASLDRLRNAYRQIDAMEAAYRARDGAEKAAMDVVK